MKKIIIISFIVLTISCKKDKKEPTDTNEPESITSEAGAGVTDVDGNNYSTISLGNGQEWMAEN